LHAFPASLLPLTAYRQTEHPGAQHSPHPAAPVPWQVRSVHLRKLRFNSADGEPELKALSRHGGRELERTPTQPSRAPPALAARGKYRCCFVGTQARERRGRGGEGRAPGTTAPCGTARHGTAAGLSPSRQPGTAEERGHRSWQLPTSYPVPRPPRHILVLLSPLLWKRISKTSFSEGFFF